MGWTHNADLDTIDIGGHDFAATKKYRDVERTGRTAVVIDDILPPWEPRGIEIRGEAEVLSRPEPMIRIHPRRIVSWGLESAEPGRRQARDVK